MGAYHKRQGTFAPVPPEGPADPEYIVIGEEPGNVEVRQRRPMVGQSGQFLDVTLNRLDIFRDQVYLDNALLCRPDNNDLDKFIAEHVRPENDRRRLRNQELRKEGRPTLEMLMTPQEACRGHIIELIRSKPDVPVITLGGLAYWAVTGKKKGLDKIRGSFNEFYVADDGHVTDVSRFDLPQPVGSERIKVLPTYNPAWTLRGKPAYKGVLERDIERAVRWKKDTLEWTEPGLLSLRPTVADVRYFVHAVRTTAWKNPEAPGVLECPWITWDLETTMEPNLENKLRTVGLFSPVLDTGIVIPWVSINGQVGFAPGLTLTNPSPSDLLYQQGAGQLPGLLPWWESFRTYHYSEAEGLEIRRLLLELFGDPNVTKVGHNSNYFDWTVLDRHLGQPPGGYQNMLDQILLMRAWNSETPRSLYFAGTMMTDVPSWKGAEDDRAISRAPRSYEELAVYNNTDNGVVAKTAPRLLMECRRRGQVKVATMDHQIHDICREMRAVGLYIDEVVRAQVEQETRDKIVRFRQTISDAVGGEINPRSPQQLARLIYGKKGEGGWELPAPLYTNTGRPSTSEDAIRVLLTTPGTLTPERRAVLMAVWKLRGVEKDLSTVLLKMRRRSAGGIVGDDGVLHCDYNSFIPATGRISSSDPNTQNWRKWLRKLVRPRPGHLFIMSDYDQIELRLMCALAGVAAYLKVFIEGGDPHAVTATLIYGDVFLKELKIKQETGEETPMYTALRRFAKVFVYAVLYGGTEETVYESVSKATNDDGDLLFPNMKFSDVKKAVDAWRENAPEIPAWWEKTWEFCEQHGYVIDPIAGRRRDFPVFDRNASINLPIQGGAGVVMADGLISVRQEFHPDPVLGLGLVNQMHDALTLEVEEDRAEALRPRVEELLTKRYPHIPVTFSTSAKICLDWSEFKWMNAKKFAEAVQKTAADARKLELMALGDKALSLSWSNENQYALADLNAQIMAEKKRRDKAAKAAVQVANAAA